MHSTSFNRAHLRKTKNWQAFPPPLISITKKELITPYFSNPYLAFQSVPFKGPIIKEFSSTAGHKMYYGGVMTISELTFIIMTLSTTLNHVLQLLLCWVLINSMLDAFMHSTYFYQGEVKKLTKKFDFNDQKWQIKPYFTNLNLTLQTMLFVGQTLFRIFEHSWSQYILLQHRETQCKNIHYNGTRDSSKSCYAKGCNLAFNAKFC
jgi:hypothetical protein